MTRHHTVWLLAILFTTIWTTSPHALSASNSTRPAVKGLSQMEAQTRTKLLGDIHYDLSFKFSDKDTDKDFSGTARIQFWAKSASDSLTLDFEGGQLLTLGINGQPQKNVDYNGLFIRLPGIKAGQNEATLSFTHPYSTTGVGAYRFKDEEDGQVYLYTDFEPFEANQLFPSFDQPDLKASYTLSVDAPERWTVLTSVRENQPPKRKAGRAIWSFPESAKFSTYIFSLAAGPYQVWEDKFDKIPLRLLARRSLAKYVPVQEWFQLTKQGLAFFQTYFDYPYPFKKYDQAIVPDFNAGAMENVAMVTFSESFVPRGSITATKREKRADVILHEMAHMWFGNLVTMHWWDDLWLNESFATYMASLALVEATEFKQAWRTFYADTKQWAYWEDQLVTTHPIEGHVPATDQAFANFDGITYGKGAASLKVLSHYLGQDHFRQGVRNYFKKHAFANTKLVDFMNALSAAADKDLKNWAQEWLRTAGVNTVEAVFECKDGKVHGFKLKQTAIPDHPQLRSHRTKVALFKQTTRSSIELQKAVNVHYEGDITAVPQLDGEACPTMVYPNYQDYDYVKVHLDARTLAATKTHLSEITDPWLRSMYWIALWGEVRDASLSVSNYVDIVFAHIAKETDPTIVEAILHTIYGRRRSAASVALYWPETDSAKTSLKEKAETLAWAQLKAAKPGSDMQKVWFDAFVRLASTPPRLDQLGRLLDGQEKLAGLEIDQDRRWDILLQLAELRHATFSQRLQAEIKRDPSSRGKKSTILAQSLAASLKEKKSWYKKITDEKSSMSLAELKSAMSGLFPNSQNTLRKEWADAYFQDLPSLAKNREGEFISHFASNMAPTYCAAESVSALSDFIAKNPDLPPAALKAVRVAAQEDERCVKIRARH